MAAGTTQGGRRYVPTGCDEREHGGTRGTRAHAGEACRGMQGHAATHCCPCFSMVSSAFCRLFSRMLAWVSCSSSPASALVSACSADGNGHEPVMSRSCEVWGETEPSQWIGLLWRRLPMQSATQRRRVRPTTFWRFLQSLSERDMNALDPINRTTSMVNAATAANPAMVPALCPAPPYGSPVHATAASNASSGRPLGHAGCMARRRRDWSAAHLV